MSTGNIATIAIITLILLAIVYYVIKNKFIIINFKNGERLFCFSGGRCFDMRGRSVSAINTANVSTVNVNGSNLTGSSNIPPNYLDGLVLTEGTSGNFVLGNNTNGQVNPR